MLGTYYCICDREGLPPPTKGGVLFYIYFSTFGYSADQFFRAVAPPEKLAACQGEGENKRFPLLVYQACALT